MRGADRYTDEQKHKFEKILTREQQSMRVPPRSQSVVHDVGKKEPVDRVGPNVVSKFFYNKVVNQREKDFWKKPWGRKKVDLPLPSYLRDFKDCDTHLLGAHFSHQRRNVGISKDAETSERMMRSLSVPLSVPGPPPESHIYGNHGVRADGRLPMIGLPPRTPLENTIEMNKRMSGAMKHGHGTHPPRGSKKKCGPEKLNAFIDELTEAYALCSAHEQIASEINSMRQMAEKKAGLNLPEIPHNSTDKPIGMLKTILSKSKIKH